MRTAPIGDLTEAIKTWNPGRESATSFEYIDLSAVDNSSKEVTGAAPTVGSEAPSRARQLVAAGDVLVSTVRPNLNAVAVVPPELDGATASTGFTVLRPTSELDGRFLFHWIRSPDFIRDMVRKATGASYPAVSDRIVKDSQIPAPPLPEQRRIAAILDHADALCTTRRQVLTHLDDLGPAIFRQMFGNPVTNDRNWPLERLANLGTLDRGVSKHRPRNDPALLGGAHPLIQTGDVANSGGYIRNFHATYSDLGLAQSRMWPAGTLCITIAANIAKTGILTFDACFPDSVVGFTSDRESTTFVQAWLGFLQATLEASAPQSAQKNINLAILRELKVPVPGGDLVKEFHERVCAVKEQRANTDRGQTALDAMFTSLQSQAFRGEV